MTARDVSPKLCSLGRLLIAAALGAAGLALSGAAGGSTVPLVQIGPAAWSPDGKKIVFGRYALRDEVTQIVVMNASGTDRKVIWARHRGDRGWDAENPEKISYSPDGRRLAFAAYFQLVVTDRNGRTLREWRNHWSFEWGPAGERLVDAPYLYGPLTVLSVKDGRKHKITRAQDSSPTWSPDGKWIAFVRDRGKHLTPNETGPSEVYLIRARGGGLRRLTRRGGIYPLWSPKGDRIAFENRSSWEIWSLRRNHALGQRLARIPATPAKIYFGLPRWSKDGNRLLFIRPGSPIARILDQRHAAGVTFSPDGRRILFGAVDPVCTKNGLWVLTVASHHLRQLVRVKHCR